MKKLLLVIFFTIVPVLAHGATYYVAKTGSDSNSCNSAQSQSTPKLTINAGAGCLSAGDTLIVKAGTYSEILNNVIPSGTASTPTIVRSETQYGAVIQATQSLVTGQSFNQHSVIAFSNQSYITLDGFTTDASSVTGVFHVWVSGASHHITVTNSEMRGGIDNNSTSNNLGFYLDLLSHDVTMSHNKIHDIGTGAVAGQGFYSYGVYWHGDTHLFEYNEVYNMSGHGIHMYITVEGNGNNNIIRNNIIHDNGSRGILLGSGGTNNVAYNNVLYGNAYFDGGAAIQVGGYGASSSGNKVYNNTAYNNVGRGINIGSQYGGPTGTIVRNNIMYQNGTDAIGQSNDTGSVTDHNLIGTNPLFVNAGSHDFHLQAGSPAIDAGVVAMSGQQYNGSAPDLGAFEFGAGGQLPVPTNLRLVVK